LLLYFLFFKNIFFTLGGGKDRDEVKLRGDDVRRNNEMMWLYWCRRENIGMMLGRRGGRERRR
jgi:hypothetical protein